VSGPHSHEKNVLETRNFARYCIENPHIAWVLLLGTNVWGIYGYTHMPQRKDPDVPVKQALVITPWPGASAEKVEELVTRTVETTIASNSNVAYIDSASRSNVSIITLGLRGSLKETGQVLDDIGGRLAAMHDLPDGAGPIDYVRDFGDTATLMLTVASPKADTAEIAVRAEAIRNRIEQVRATKGAARDLRLLEGAGFVGLDRATRHSDLQLLSLLGQFLNEHYPQSQVHPDLWGPFVVRDPADTQKRLAAVAGDKDSYRELEDFTEAMEKALLATGRKGEGTSLVAKVDRSGILPERI
jgi:AcrB/AcrD/AcrF family